MTHAAPPPFRSSGTLPPLFFLHIPKTAGSALNAGLAQMFGADRCLFHAEAFIDAIARGDRPPMQADCVTGHLPWAKWRASGSAASYAPVTVLRAPWERLVSHLNWMDRFNHGLDAATLPRLPRGYQAVVATLARTDFDSRASLAQLLGALRRGAGRRLFDNLQVRMLAASATPEMAAIEAGHVDDARNVLAGFAAVGRADALDGLMAALAGRLGVAAPVLPADAPVNPARSHRVRVSNAVAREVLAPFWELDARLLDRVLPAGRPAP
jgi:hypothetical protein